MGKKTKTYNDPKNQSPVDAESHLGGVQTNGFDISYAITADGFNKLLASSWSSLDPTMKYSGSANDGTTYNLNAQMGPWELTAGGSNSLLRFTIPYVSGTFEYTSMFGSEKTDLAGFTVEVEVKLGWIGNGGTVSSKGSDNNNTLTFDIESSSTKQGDTKQGAVTAIAVHTPSGTNPPSGNTEQLLKLSTSESLVQNKDKLKPAMAKVQLSSPDAAWMKPKQWMYYYVEPADLPPTLCILTLLRGGDMPPPSFDTNVLKNDKKYSVFCILSQEQFLKNGIMPGLPAAYNATPEQFEYTPSGSMGTDKGEIDLVGKLKCEKVGDSQPYIKSLKLVIEGDELKSTFSGKCDVAGLVNTYIDYSGHTWAHSSYTSKHEFVFGETSSTTKATKHIPMWVKIGTLDGFGLVDKCVQNCRDSVCTNVTSVVSEGIGNIAVSTVKWFTQDVNPVDGGLDGGIYVRGFMK